MASNFDLKLVNMAPTLLHINPELEIVLVHSGSVRISLGYCEFMLTSGQFTVIPPYRLHSFSPDDGAKSDVFLFSHSACADFFNMYVNKELQNHIFLLSDVAYAYIKATTQDFSENPDIFLSKALLYAFLSAFSKNSTFSNMSVDTSSVNRIVEYIFLNLQTDLTAKSVAAEFAISEARLSEMLIRYVGLSFKELIVSMRIDRSMELLMKTDLSITEVAFESGFESLRTFNRTFSKMSGTTPSEYRKISALLK